MTLAEQLKALLEGVEPEAFSKALLDVSSDHYQFVYNAGHSAATGKWKERAAGFESQVADSQTKIDTLTTQIEELRKAQPDTGKLQEQYQGAINKLQSELEAEKEKSLSSAKDWRSTVSNLERSTIQASIVNRLVDEGVDREYAEFKVQVKDFNDRLQFDEKTGRFTGAMQPDGLVPVIVPPESRVEDVLAKDVLKNVPTKFISDRRQRGTLNGQPGQSGGVIWLTREESSNPQVWDEAHAKAKESGAEVRLKD